MAFSRSPNVVVTALTAFAAQFLCELWVQRSGPVDWPQTLGGAAVAAVYFAIMVGPWPGQQP
jgi:hypothetical protein